MIHVISRGCPVHHIVVPLHVGPHRLTVHVRVCHIGTVRHMEDIPTVQIQVASHVIVECIAMIGPHSTEHILLSLLGCFCTLRVFVIVVQTREPTRSVEGTLADQVSPVGHISMQGLHQICTHLACDESLNVGVLIQCLNWSS